VRFSAEQLDERWARETATAFEDDLKDASAGRWSMVSIECATSLCRGTLKWPSYHQATASLMPLLVAHYKNNCKVSVALPPPPDVGAPYDGNVFFDCATQRAE
jgi:hypothetical protein